MDVTRQDWSLLTGTGSAYEAGGPQEGGGDKDDAALGGDAGRPHPRQYPQHPRSSWLLQLVPPPTLSFYLSIYLSTYFCMVMMN